MVLKALIRANSPPRAWLLVRRPIWGAPKDEPAMADSLAVRRVAVTGLGKDLVALSKTNDPSCAALAASWTDVGRSLHVLKVPRRLHPRSTEPFGACRKHNAQHVATKSA